jgi:hypothetical protein
MPEELNRAKTNGLMDAKPSLMEDWNNYVAWMKDRGYSGSPKMNKPDFSSTVLEEYRMDNPNTSITPETISQVQAEIINYRTQAIEMAKRGKIKMAEDPGKDYEKFMPWVPKTGVDAINGQYTSQFRFPDWYVVNPDKEKRRMGYAIQ